MTLVARTIPILVALLSLSCAGDSGTNPVQPSPTPATPPPATPPAPITISVQTSIVVGQIVAATASVSSGAITWSSSNPTVAVISPDGSVTGVGVGVDTLKAVSGSSSGAAVITVAPALQLPAGISLLNLKIGYAAAITPAVNARGWAIPPGGDYVVIAANTNPLPDVTAQYAVSVQPATSAASASVGTSHSILAAPETPSIERLLRAYERTQLELYEKTAFAKVSSERARYEAPRFNTVTTDVRIGDRASFQFYNFVSRTQSVVDAVVVMVSPHSVIVADTIAPAGGFTSADYQAFANEFENVTYPTDTTYFGKPSDVDGNGRVIMLFTKEVNKLTPPGSGGYYGGFFNALDLFPTSSNSRSNAGEIFYLAVPDPANQLGVKLPTDQLRTNTRATLAHEFQHMINAGNRIALGPIAGFEESWLDEGLAHMAEDLVGRGMIKAGGSERLTSERIRASFDDYKAFFISNLLRFGDWASGPNSTGANSLLGASSSAQRGAIWSLVRRAADFHGGSLAAFTRTLAAGPRRGVANISAAAGVSWDTLVSEWLVANVADGLIGPGGGPNGYASYDIHSVAIGGTYPLRISPAIAGLNVGSVVSGSGAYYSIQPGGGQVVTLTTSDGSASATYPGARMMVVRVR